MKHHITVSIRFFNGMADDRLLACFPGQGTADDIRARLAELRAQGYEYVPGCDNCDGKGQCLGHE